MATRCSFQKNKLAHYCQDTIRSNPTVTTKCWAGVKTATTLRRLSMQTAQHGDRVQVHYKKRFQDGTVTSSRNREPVEMTVGVNHPRLPGLGLALVGLAPGSRKTLTIPADLAYGQPDPKRIHRVSRKRFPANTALEKGAWIRLTNDRGRRRLIRVLEVSDQTVVIDANHRWAGQAMEVEVELIGIRDNSLNATKSN
jgi:peptidylprolyl isomerase